MRRTVTDRRLIRTRRTEHRSRQRKTIGFIFENLVGNLDAEDGRTLERGIGDVAEMAVWRFRSVRANQSERAGVARDPEPEISRSCSVARYASTEISLIPVHVT